MIHFGNKFTTHTNKKELYAKEKYFSSDEMLLVENFSLHKYMYSK